MGYLSRCEWSFEPPDSMKLKPIQNIYTYFMCSMSDAVNIIFYTQVSLNWRHLAIRLFSRGWIEINELVRVAEDSCFASDFRLAGVRYGSGRAESGRGLTLSIGGHSDKPK